MSAAGDHPGGGTGPGSSSADIERIIERGLQLFSTGDVDAALSMWEQALALDPHDARAAAYVDYVRENYSMLSSSARAGEEEVPFGLGAVPGDPADDYEIEVTTGGTPMYERAAVAPIAPVERYIESIDEGWFLDEELPAGFTFDEPPPRPAESLPPFELDPADTPSRPSRQLPLPANPAELSIEMEADEPDDAIGLDPDTPSFDTPLASGGEEDDKTGDFGLGNRWAQAAGAAPSPPDFTDQKSAVPTQEIAAPRGFVRTRLPPVASAAESKEGLAAAGTAAPAPEPDDDDDRLRTRPGRITGDGPLEPTGGVPRGVAPEVLSQLGGEFGGGTGTGHGGRAIGPDERTRELPKVRVTFNPDTQDLPAPPDLELGEASDLPPVLRLDPQFERHGTDDPEERTLERNAARYDTLSETTTERAPGGRYTTPAPIDEPPGEASGKHPPLVIVEDPVLSEGAHDRGDRSTADGGPRRLKPPTPAPPEPPPEHAADSGEYDLHPGTARVRRLASAVMPVASPTGASPAGTSIEEIAAALEAALTATAPATEAKGDRTRRRVGDLMERAVTASTAGDHATAIVALDLALKEDPESAVGQKLIHRHQPAILDVYQRFLGDLSARPTLAMPMHELSDQKLDIRAAFLLSRIDGALTFEEILDVSGMARGEAFRHLSMLLLRGILEVR